METQKKTKTPRFDMGDEGVFTPKKNGGIPISPRANTLSSQSAVRSPTR